MKYPHPSKTVGGMAGGRGTPPRRDTPNSASLFGDAESARMAQWENLVVRSLPNRSSGVTFVSPWGRSASTPCWSPATTIAGSRITTTIQHEGEEQYQQPNDDPATTSDEERRFRIYSALHAALLISQEEEDASDEKGKQEAGLLEHHQSSSLGGD